MNTEEKCEIIRAIDEGVGIQRRKVPGGNWTDVTGKDSWLNFDLFDYRKKPKPRVRFANEYKCTSRKGTYLYGFFETEDGAKVASSPGCLGQVKFIEENKG